MRSVIFVCVCVATASADSFGSYGSFSAALEEEAPAIEPFSGECRDKFMTGELELPYEGFGTCELTAGFGLCDFELADRSSSVLVCVAGRTENLWVGAWPRRNRGD